MDLLEIYESIMVKVPSCLDLRVGDMVYIKIPKLSFLSDGVSSGLCSVTSVVQCEYHEWCPHCISNGICIYIDTKQYSCLTKGCCECYVYTSTGQRFIEDFPYYKEHPNYEE